MRQFHPNGVEYHTQHSGRGAQHKSDFHDECGVDESAHFQQGAAHNWHLHELEGIHFDNQGRLEMWIHHKVCDPILSNATVAVRRCLRNCPHPFQQLDYRHKHPPLSLRDFQPIQCKHPLCPAAFLTVPRLSPKPCLDR